MIEFFQSIFPYIIPFLLGLAALSVVMYFVFYFVASYFVYKATLKRTSKEKWARTQNTEDAQHIQMDDEGMAWHKANKEYARNVHITNDGLCLAGEYYDFGKKRCVIMLCGRPDSLRYGYYYVQPYSRADCNVLLVDTRAHGESEGTCITGGITESRDVLAWIRFLHDKCGMESVFIHGICVGAAAGMLALTSEDCPSCVEGIITDGLFTNFAQSMSNHLIERKKPCFPVMQFINFWMNRDSGCTMNYGPLDVISKMDKRLLMLHSKDDAYSLPETAKQMFDLCPSKNKKIVWFEKCAHSYLRVTSPQKYDSAVIDFVNSLFEIKV